MLTCIGDVSNAIQFAIYDLVEYQQYQELVHMMMLICLIVVDLKIRIMAIISKIICLPLNKHKI